MNDETKDEVIEEVEVAEEQPSLFGKVDVLRNTLEAEMTIITEAIDKASASISRLEVKIGSLETRKAKLYAMVKAVKEKEIVLGNSEDEDTEEILLESRPESL